MSNPPSSFKTPEDVDWKVARRWFAETFRISRTRAKKILKNHFIQKSFVALFNSKPYLQRPGIAYMPTSFNQESILKHITKSLRIQLYEKNNDNNTTIDNAFYPYDFYYLVKVEEEDKKFYVTIDEEILKIIPVTSQPSKAMTEIILDHAHLMLTGHSEKIKKTPACKDDKG